MRSHHHVLHSRHLLRDFEARLPELRRQLSTGQEWFEVFSVPKRHYKQEVLDYARALATQQKLNTPIPAEIQAGDGSFGKKLREFVYDTVFIGPYVKYRWTEQKRTYAISLGLRSLAERSETALLSSFQCSFYHLCPLRWS